MSEKFTWIPFYEEMAQKLLAFKDNRKELIDLVYSLGPEYTDYIYDEQIDENGKVKKDEKGKKLRQRVNDIDPFSVMAIFNRKILDENRNAIVQKFKELLKIEAGLPEDYDSIPILMNLQSTLYWRKTASAEIPILWNIFEAAMNGNDNLGNYFDEIVKYKGIKWNITIVLYWCFPHKFIALDSVSRDFLKDKCGIVLENEKITYSEYQDVMNRVRSKFNDANFGVKNFPELSNAAYRYAIKKQKVWIAGASISNKPYMEKFYKEGYWEGGPGDSPLQLECLKTIKKGDLIALKTRKGIIPKYDVADLEICYVGVVDEDSKATNSDNTWFSFRVRWFKDFPRTVYPKMYKKPYNGTIGKCTDKKILKDIISFAEEGTLVMTETEQKIRNYTILLKNKQNIILQGAPGTGKTYNTAALALSMIGKLPVRDADEDDKSFHKKVMDEYEKHLIKFDEEGNVAGEGQIGFVTFHQSMDYEDFVEGIKPKTNNGQVSYEIENGIFKTICKNASQIKSSKKSAKIDFSKTRIFKMSLGEKGKSDTEVFDYCRENNVIALGWGRDIDFSDCKNKEDIKAKDSTWGAFAIEVFKLWMRVGDIVLISDGNRAIKAIARIAGEYEFHVDKLETMKQYRNVEWLYVGDSIPISRLYDKNLSQQSIYAFGNRIDDNHVENGSIKEDVINDIITGDIEKETPKNYVLIIDEINRGNVSKIFGELISLLEADKRVGGNHPLSVTLPYSKEPFSVPPNLYIIGTMNTTDRSVGSIDYAVRRRFAFVTLEADENKVPEINARNLFNAVKYFLNKSKYDMDIEDLMVGHSYFMTSNEGSLKMKWQYEILPLLMEYHKDGIISRSPLKDDFGNEITDVKKDYTKFIEAWQKKESDTNP
jgi:hypothetical protein